MLTSVLDDEIGIRLSYTVPSSSPGQDISDSLDALPPANPLSHGNGNVVYAQSGIVDQLVCVDTCGSTNRSFPMSGTPEENATGEFVLILPQMAS